MKFNKKRKQDEHAGNGDTGHTNDGSENGVEEPAAKKLNKAKTDLYRPPTNEELQQLRETEYLFHSSLFRLQLTELLKEVRLGEKKSSALADYLSSLQNALRTLPVDKTDCQLKDNRLVGTDIVLPLQCRLNSIRGSLRFEPPTAVKIAGSHCWQLNIKPNIRVDLCLELPKACIHPKDYLNQRYLMKRACYLAAVASKLKKAHSDLVEAISFSCHRSNRMIPILVLKPRGEGLSHVSIRLHTSIPDGTFKLHRFHVERNNVRSKWFNSVDDADDATEGGQEGDESATPHYNALHLEEMLRCQLTDSISHALKDLPEVRDGIALLKVWLRQRELDEGYGGFSSFIITMYVVYLLKKRHLTASMSSYQVLRNTLLHLAQSKWDVEGITLAENATPASDLRPPSLVHFHAAFDVVFVDFSGYLNICSQMNVAVYNMVKHEASLALTMLEASETDNFELLLVKPVPFVRRFDQLIHIDHLENLQLCAVKQNLDAKTPDHSGDNVNLCLPSLLGVLHKALGRRVRLIGFRLQPTREWHVTELPPKGEDIITFGLLLNEEHCYGLIDRGPPADSAEAKLFREFWGDVSEMRRFQDGSICEAVVWKGKTLADRRTITAQIVKHVLDSHAAIPRGTVTFVSSQLDVLLKLPQPHKKKFALTYGTGEEQHLALMTTFDDLRRQLCGLRDLPLALNTVQGVAPAFRFTEVFPPLNARIVGTRTERNEPSLRHNQWRPCLKVLCFPEISGSWPDDYQALRRAKAEYYLQLAALIRSQLKLTCLAYADHLLVYKAKYAFHLEVAYPKEIGAMRTVVTEDGMTRTVDSDAARELEVNIVHLPKLSTHLHGVQQTHISFGAAVRLAKRWLSAHLLLDGHFSPEAVELLVAHIYLSPAPFTVPCTPQVALVRFLRLLTSHDWQTQPIIVNFNSELTREDIVSAQKDFTRDRSTLPLVCIITPMDHTGATWTRRRPQPVIMQRVVVLARESLRVLEVQLLDNSIDTDFRQIFRPSLDAFDVVIHLNVNEVKRHYEAVDLSNDVSRPRYSTEQSETEDVKALLKTAEFDPVRSYLDELRETFDDVALFFYDIYGGDKIAVLWKPTASQSCAFKVSHVNFSMVRTGSKSKEVELSINKEAVLEDWRVMGEGLVERVELVVKT